MTINVSGEAAIAGVANTEFSKSSGVGPGQRGPAPRYHKPPCHLGHKLRESAGREGGSFRI